MEEQTCQFLVEKNQIEVEVWTSPVGHKMAFFAVCNNCDLILNKVEKKGNHDWSILNYYDWSATEYRSRVKLVEKVKLKQTTLEVE